MGLYVCKDMYVYDCVCTCKYLNPEQKKQGGGIHRYIYSLHKTRNERTKQKAKAIVQSKHPRAQANHSDWSEKFDPLHLPWYATLLNILPMGESSSKFLVSGTIKGDRFCFAELDSYMGSMGIVLCLLILY